MNVCDGFVNKFLIFNLYFFLTFYKLHGAICTEFFECLLSVCDYIVLLFKYVCG